MRTVVWLLLLAAVAVVTAATLGTNDGLVSVYWAPWRIDFSLNLFLVGLVAACFAVYSVVRTLNALIGLPQRAREWRVARRDRTAQAALREALALYFGGRYTRAHKAAQRAVTIQADTPELSQDHDFAALGHLLSAGSLHRLQDRARRDEHLDRALDLSRRLAVGVRPTEEGARLLAAEWALDDRDAGRALEGLSELPPGVARRTHALRLKLQAARVADQPLEALKTARLLAKHQGFSPVAAQGLLRSLACQALESARDADQLRRTWMQFDAVDRRDAHVAARAATHASKLGAPETGRAWLRPFWERLDAASADDRAVLAAALVASIRGLTADWLPVLEAAVQAFPREPAIAYAVGSALAERELWGKARRLLEFAAEAPALDGAQRRHAWRVLAGMAEKEDNAERVAACYRAAALID